MAIRQAVLYGFVLFSTEFESDVDYFYLDVMGLVTIGVGLLVDPWLLAFAMGLVFLHPDGEEASSSEIEAAWKAVKARRDLAPFGGGHFAPLTTIRATKASLAAAAQRKIGKFEADLRRFFPDWDDFPAPGQLLLLSMAWAMGSGAFLHWPHFCAAVNAGRWADVAVPHSDPASCLMSEAGQNASFHLRNLADVELAKAAQAAADGGDLEALDVGGIIAAAKVARAAEATAPARR